MRQCDVHELVGVLWMILASLQDDGSKFATWFAITGCVHLFIGLFKYIKDGK